MWQTLLSEKINLCTCFFSPTSSSKSTHFGGDGNQHVFGLHTETFARSPFINPSTYLAMIFLFAFLKPHHCGVKYPIRVTRMTFLWQIQSRWSNSKNCDIFAISSKWIRSSWMWTAMHECGLRHRTQWHMFMWFTSISVHIHRVAPTDSSIDKGKSLKNHHMNDAPSISQGKRSENTQRLHLCLLSFSPHLSMRTRRYFFSFLLASATVSWEIICRNVFKFFITRNSNHSLSLSIRVCVWTTWIFRNMYNLMHFWYMWECEPFSAVCCIITDYN